MVTQTGALAAWHDSGSTGRIPQDTYMVDHGAKTQGIDWSAAACHPMEPHVFDALLADAVADLGQGNSVLVTDCRVGSRPGNALPVRMITDSALTALFADNMFPDALLLEQESIFEKPFHLVVLPKSRVRTERYEGKLRKIDGKTVDRVIAMDFERRLGIVYGTSYLGAVKKVLFTVMNYLLPAEGILPLHCGANESREGTALFLGLSGTGKTTLSTVKGRELIGDDEHAWSDAGIENLEDGCYAKLIRLSAEKEPEIHSAVFSQRDPHENGCIIENTMTFPDGSVDTDDDRLTENSRASYPLSFLPHSKMGGISGHPNRIIFLTADANGVLPPVAVLSPRQALLWFLLGYTSKLAGTETGVITPKSTFSRFFGAPFMPRHPMDYVDLLARKLAEHRPQIILINTGWTGGPYGVGARMDLGLTRALVDAALSGEIAGAPLCEDSRFHLRVPTACPGIDPRVLDPLSNWRDPQAYEARADALAQEFSTAFTKEFAGRVPADLANLCPGK